MVVEAALPCSGRGSGAGRAGGGAMKRLREQADAAAARYCMTGGAAEAQSAEVPAQKIAQVNTPTGGRQRRKEQLRRQAAAAGVDVLSWTVRRWQQGGGRGGRSDGDAARP